MSGEVTKTDVVPIREELDIVRVRKTVRDWATEMGFGVVDLTKLVTAASELARNVWVHGRGGQMSIERVADGPRNGLRMMFEDQGPGIPDVDLALKDGYTTGTGMGLGLGGARRLVNDFRIETTPGQGTRITIARYK